MNTFSFAMFLPSSTGLPDPHDVIITLHALTDLEQQIEMWFQTQKQSQPLDSVGINAGSGWLIYDVMDITSRLPFFWFKSMMFKLFRK